MGLTTLTDDDLDALRVAVLTEQERRALLASAPAQAEALAATYAAAIGRKDGDPWTQPTGAHDAYAKGARVRFDGKVYESRASLVQLEPNPATVVVSRLSRLSAPRLPPVSWATRPQWTVSPIRRTSRVPLAHRDESSMLAILRHPVSPTTHHQPVLPVPDFFNHRHAPLMPDVSV